LSDGPASGGFTRTYRSAIGVSGFVVERWGRLRVSGLEHLPETGPVLLAANHDSYWDTVSIGAAALPVRQVRALAKVQLWDTPGLGWVLNGMGQIPIERGAGDADALDSAVRELRDGACIGIFPEGTRSRGGELRPRSGIGRLATRVPEAEIVCCSVVGTTDFVRFPKRPEAAIRFFRPAEGGLKPGEEPAEFSARLIREIRAGAPFARIGRRRK